MRQLLLITLVLFSVCVWASDVRVATVDSSERIKGINDSSYRYDSAKYIALGCQGDEVPCSLAPEDHDDLSLCYSGPVGAVCAAVEEEFRKNHRRYQQMETSSINLLKSCRVDATTVAIEYWMYTDDYDYALRAERVLSRCE